MLFRLARISTKTSLSPIGTHVEVVGSFVLDKEQGRLAEIHPVTSIRQQK